MIIKQSDGIIRLHLWHEQMVVIGDDISVHKKYSSFWSKLTA